MNERLATCYHEAGHAVVGFALGLTPALLELHPPGQQPVAAVTWAKNWREMPLWGHPTVSYSGPAAEARALGCEIDDTLFQSFHEKSDLAKLGSSCQWLWRAGHFLSREAALNFAVAQADQMLDEHWHRVEAVAEALYSRGRLRQAQIYSAAQWRGFPLESYYV